MSSQRHQGQAGFRRPGVFHSLEIFDNVDGEWLRNNEESNPPLPQLITAWADKTGVDIVFVSPPSFRYLEFTDTRRVSMVGVSILYRPIEVIDDGQTVD